MAKEKRMTETTIKEKENIDGNKEPSPTSGSTGKFLLEVSLQIEHGNITNIDNETKYNINMSNKC